MPELPEVETIRVQLASQLEGRTITDTWTSPNPKFTGAANARGATITSLSRRGKFLIGGLSGDRELIIHLGMTGVLRFTESGEPGPHVRVRFALDDGNRLELNDVRQFGRIAVVAAGDYRGHPTLAALGPEPFDEAFTAERLYRSLKASTARVKTQLLSQRVVAGVGNIYADEALWRAGIYPGARAVTKRQAAGLRDALVATLAQGVANGGTTLRDYRNVEGGSGTNQLALDCYGRAGLGCRRCDAPLVRKVFDGRSATYCPTCQPPRKR